LGVTRLVAREKNQILGQTRKMRQKHRSSEEIIGGEIAIRNGIERVGCGTSEAEGLRQLHAVDRKRSARQGSGTERTLVATFMRRSEAADVALQHLHVRQTPMSERDRFGLPGVRVPRHRSPRLFL